ncbi:MAG TPA: hypothetical protein VG722_07235 [Tepidisphaeraceae bacterium]|nr:hypothetical protein [Tepidisphaeraceae bacterium]
MSRFILIFSLLACLAGCDAPLHKSHQPSSLASSQYYMIPSVKMPASLSSANCGAQALGTACASLRPPGISFAPEQLQIWQKAGATPLDLLITARVNGFSAHIHDAQWNSLLNAARSNTRALVLFDSTIEVWTPFGWFRRPNSQAIYHWAAVSGFARDGSALLLAAPGGRDYIIKRDSFIHRWSRADDCLITIGLPPVAAAQERN